MSIDTKRITARGESTQKRLLFRKIQTSQATRDKQSPKKASLPVLLPNKLKAMDSCKQNMAYETFLSKVNLGSQKDEATVVSSYLNALKRDFDRLQSSIVTQLAETDRKRKEIVSLKDQSLVVQGQLSGVHGLLECRTGELHECQAKNQSSITELKTLRQIVDRMKIDEVHFKHFSKSLQAKLTTARKELKVKTSLAYQEDVALDKIASTLNKLNSVYETNKETRVRKFDDFCQGVCEIKQRDAFIMERNERTAELQKIESTDVLNTKHVHMLNMLKANKVFDMVLENKINRLLTKYAPLEKAFHSIKTKTPIADPGQLAQKFFSYEESTEQIIQAVQQNEKKLKYLCDVNKMLREEYENACAAGLLQNEELSQSQVCHVSAEKSRVLLQTTEYQLTLDRIKCWIARFAETLDCDGTDDVVKMAEICRQACTEIQAMDASGIQNLPKFVGVGVRIKKLVREVTKEEEAMRLREAQQFEEFQAIEGDYIRMSRIGLKKNFQIKTRSGKDNTFGRFSLSSAQP